MLLPSTAILLLKHQAVFIRPPDELRHHTKLMWGSSLQLPFSPKKGCFLCQEATATVTPIVDSKAAGGLIGMIPFLFQVAGLFR